VLERHGCENVGVQILHYCPSQPTARCQNIRHRLRRGSPPVRYSYGWIPMPSCRFPRLPPVFVCRGPQELCCNISSATIAEALISNRLLNDYSNAFTLTPLSFSLFSLPYITILFKDIFKKCLLY
jgi:hypothetical protein